MRARAGTCARRPRPGPALVRASAMIAVAAAVMTAAAVAAVVAAVAVAAAGGGWWLDAPHARWGEPWLGPRLLDELEAGAAVTGPGPGTGYDATLRCGIRVYVGLVGVVLQEGGGPPGRCCGAGRPGGCQGLLSVSMPDGGSVTVSVPSHARVYRDGRACSLGALVPVPQGEGLPDLQLEALVACRVPGAGRGGCGCPDTACEAYYIEALCPVVEVTLLDLSPPGAGRAASRGEGGRVAVAPVDGSGGTARHVYVLEVLPGPWESIMALRDVRGRNAVVVLDMRGRVRVVRVRL